MNYINRKTLIIAGIVIFLIALVGLVWYLTTSQKSGISNQLPLGLIESSRGEIYYFNRSDLSFYKKTQDETVMLVTLGYEPFTMVYSPDRSKVVILGSAEEQGRAIDLVNLSTKSITTLDLRIINAVFSEDNSKLAYHFYDPKNLVSSIYVEDILDNGVSGPQLVANLDYAENLFYIIRWKDKDNVLVLPMQSDDYLVNILELNLNTNKSKIVLEGSMLDFLVDPQTKNLIVLNTNDSSNEHGTNGTYSINIFQPANKKTTSTGIDVYSLTQMSFSAAESGFYVAGSSGGNFGLYFVDKNGTPILISDLLEELSDSIIEVFYSAFEKKVYIVTEQGILEVNIDISTTKTK